MRAGLIGLAAVSLACSAREASSTVEEAPLEIEGPVVARLRESDLPVVEVALDGHVGLAFLVDTGAALTFFALDRAEALGLELGRYSHATTTTGTGGHTMTYDRYVRIERLAIGGLSLRNLRVPVLEDEIFEVLGIAGILGQDLLARLVVILDSRRGSLHLLPPDTGAAGIEAYLGESKLGQGAWLRAPIELRPSPFLPLDVQGLEPGSTSIELDTGADSTSLPGAVIEALGLEPARNATHRGIGGEYESPAYMLENLSLFGLRITTEVHRSALDYGLLGMNVLGELVVVLDGPGEELWLHHRQPEPAAAGEGEGD